MVSITEGKDLIGIAQTGTGKTAAFSLPLLERMKQNDRQFKSRNPNVLILAPTRELASQIGESIENYGKEPPLSTYCNFRRGWTKTTGQCTAPGSKYPDSNSRSLDRPDGPGLCSSRRGILLYIR